MGDALMKQVVRDWGDLPGNAYKVLIVMASCAMDQAEKPKYYGGWQRLAIVGLGRRDWPADSDGSAAAHQIREAHRKRVVVAVRELIGAHAISSAQVGRQTLRAEYWLTLDRVLSDGKRPAERTESVQKPDGNRPENGRKPSHQIPSTPNESQGGKPISPMGVRHQGDGPPVDKRRSTSDQLEVRRAQLAAEQGAA